MAASANAALTLRLAEDVRRDLETVARAQGTSIAEEIRTAVAAHLERKRRDEGFVRQLESLIDDQREFLDKLTE